jgi:hypothetical protein
MQITDLQFCFILIKALPESHSAVASTILATGAPTLLTLLIVQEQILNKESHHAGPSTSINKVAPVHRNDKSKVKCFYCDKPGHKSPDCRKKKHDEKEKKEKEKEKEKEKAGTSSGSISKSVNAHIQVVPTSATIEEISDNEDVCVSLYTA